MVLESILNPENAAGSPLKVFVIAIIFCFVAVIFAFSLFPEQSSILTISIITIMFIPFFYHIFKKEELKDDLIAEHKDKNPSDVNLLLRHKKTIVIYSAYFLGIVVGMTIIFAFMPQYGKVFDLQVAQPALAQYTSGNATVSLEIFFRYFFNNSRVMILAFILSALLGTGGIFVLAWNASIISVYIGLKAIAPMMQSGTNSIVAFILGVPAGLASIAIWGIPEILGYIMAGLAGGILSVGIIREELESNKFREVLKDALFILILGEAFIVAGAILETVF
ncbi:MAG: stage II sporulation protein M [Candidatus Aenigmatarchaeota archaeon]